MLLRPSNAHESNSQGHLVVCALDATNNHSIGWLPLPRPAFMFVYPKGDAGRHCPLDARQNLALVPPRSVLLAD